MKPSHGICFFAGLLIYAGYDLRDAGSIWIGIGAVCLALWCIAWERN